MFPIPKGVIVLITLSLAALGVMIIVDLLVPPSPEDQLRALRSQLAQLRLASDSCRSALEREEKRLRAADARLDSLRGRIDHYEGLDSRGVPADSYEIYLEAFDTYNAGIPARKVAAETLVAHWRECRALAETHNRTADSAREIAEELGLVGDSSRAGSGS